MPSSMGNLAPGFPIDRLSAFVPGGTRTTVVFFNRRCLTPISPTPLAAPRSDLA
jgi:hypothetical protein